MNREQHLYLLPFLYKKIVQVHIELHLSKLVMSAFAKKSAGSFDANFLSSISSNKTSSRLSSINFFSTVDLPTCLAPVIKIQAYSLEADLIFPLGHDLYMSLIFSSHILIQLYYISITHHCQC